MEFERIVDTDGVLAARGVDGALRARCSVCHAQLPVVTAPGDCAEHPLASADIAVLLGGHLSEAERAAEEARLLGTIWATPVEPALNIIPERSEQCRGRYVDSPGKRRTSRGNGADQSMT